MTTSISSEAQKIWKDKETNWIIDQMFNSAYQWKKVRDDAKKKLRKSRKLEKITFTSFEAWPIDIGTKQCID